MSPPKAPYHRLKFHVTTKNPTPPLNLHATAKISMPRSKPRRPTKRLRHQPQGASTARFSLRNFSNLERMERTRGKALGTAPRPPASPGQLILSQSATDARQAWRASRQPAPPSGRVGCDLNLWASGHVLVAPHLRLHANLIWPHELHLAPRTPRPAPSELHVVSRQRHSRGVRTQCRCGRNRNAAYIGSLAMA